MAGIGDPAGRPVVMIGLSARAWWVSVGVVCVALVVFAAFPRYEVQAATFSVADSDRPLIVRLDRWTGRVEVVPPYYARNIVPVRAPQWLSVMPVFDPVAPATQ